MQVAIHPNLTAVMVTRGRRLGRKRWRVPTPTIAAIGGFEETTVMNCLNSLRRFWLLGRGPQFSETLSDACPRRATSEAAEANYDGTVASYRQTTLNEFQEVEDNLAETYAFSKPRRSSNGKRSLLPQTRFSCLRTGTSEASITICKLLQLKWLS
jgi:hypothetical protein